MFLRVLRSITLLLLVLIQLSTALDYCPFGSVGHPSQEVTASCCNGAPFTLGHVPAIRTHYNACAVEPSNANLSYAESHWEFYDCVMNKTFGSISDLTPETYASFMGSGLPPVTQRNISLDVHKGDGSFKGNSSASKIQYYWNLYFFSEFAHCGSKWRTEKKNTTNLAQLRIMWQPISACNRQKHPWILPIMLNKTKFLDCMSSFNRKLSLETRKSLGNAQTTVCAAVGSNYITVEDFDNPKLDFVPLFNQMVPPYLSRTSRDLLNVNTENVMKAHFGASQDLNTILQGLVDHVKAKHPLTAEFVKKFPDSERVYMNMQATHVLLSIGRAGLIKMCQ